MVHNLSPGSPAIELAVPMHNAAQPLVCQPVVSTSCGGFFLNPAYRARLERAGIVGGSARSVCAFLNDLLARARGGAVVRASQAALAEAWRVTLRTVQRWERALVDAGIAVVERCGRTRSLRVLAITPTRMSPVDIHVVRGRATAPHVARASEPQSQRRNSPPSSLVAAATEGGGDGSATREAEMKPENVPAVEAGERLWDRLQTGAGLSDRGERAMTCRLAQLAAEHGEGAVAAWLTEILADSERKDRPDAWAYTAVLHSRPGKRHAPRPTPQRPEPAHGAARAEDSPLGLSRAQARARDEAMASRWAEDRARRDQATDGAIQALLAREGVGSMAALVARGGPVGATVGGG